MGIAGEVPNNVTKGLQNVSQNFMNCRFIHCHKYTRGIPGSMFILWGT